MDKIFDQAKDKNVAALVIYGKGSDKKAYIDSDCTMLGMRHSVCSSAHSGGRHQS